MEEYTITPNQEIVTRIAVSCLMAIIVIFICGFAVSSMLGMTGDVMNENPPVLSQCSECHTNMNATENITPCQKCREMWSNVYT